MRGKNGLLAFIIGFFMTAVNSVGAAPVAYITNSGSNNVSVIDTATNTLVGAPIPVGLNPGGVAVNSSGTRVYVANQGSNDVSVIDAATNTVIGAPVPVGLGPVGVAVNPSGTRVYVVNQTTSNVSVIDAATNTVIGAPIPIGLNPAGVAVNPAGTRVYVTRQSGSDVAVIDAATDTVIGGPIPVGLNPVGIAVNPSGTRVYVANLGSNDVSVIDAATNTVIGAPVPVGLSPFGVAVNPSGTRVYVANQATGSVAVIDAATNTVSGAPIPVGLNPVGVAVNPSGTKVFVANFNSDSFSVIETSTNAVVSIPTGGVQPRGFGLFIGPAPKIGIYRRGAWFIDSNGSGQWDGCGLDGCLGPFGGGDGDVPIIGDWTGSRSPQIGIFRQGLWFLDFNDSGTWNGCGIDGCLGPFGDSPGDIPVAGDWLGEGRTKIGFFRQGFWFLDLNGNGIWDGCAPGEPDGCLGPFGGLDIDVPITGDWNGNRLTKIGIYRQGNWFLDVNGNGTWDGCGIDACQGPFGGFAADIPVVGDWNGEAVSRIGIFRQGFWFLDRDGSGTWGGCQLGNPDACLGPFGGFPFDIPIIK